jgi:hypothetical protein
MRERTRKKAEAEGRVIRAYQKQPEGQTAKEYRRERKNELRAIAATQSPPKTGRYALKDAHVTAYHSHTEKEAKDAELKRLKDAGMKLCTCCKTAVNLFCFSKNSRASDGLMHLCKACDSQKNRDRREADKSAHLARRKKLYKEKPEQSALLLSDTEKKTGKCLINKSS